MDTYITKSWKSAPAVSIAMENSWTPRHLSDSKQEFTSNNAIFQKMQLQEKEEKRLRLYGHQQKNTINRLEKNKPGSISSSTTNNSTSTLFTSTRGGKVRQMFDERRHKAGIDRSYPLEPLSQESTANIVTVAASSKTAEVLANTSMHKNTIITSRLTSRTNDGQITNKLNSRQTLAQSRSYRAKNVDPNKEKLTSYKLHDNFNVEVMFNRDQENSADSINRSYIEDDMSDKAKLTHMNPKLVDQAVYNGVVGKLANLGGKLPSEIMPKNTNIPINTSKNHLLIGANGLNTSRKGIKESKTIPLVKKTSSVRPTTLIGKVQSPPSALFGSLSSSSMSRPQSRSKVTSSARSAPGRSANTPATTASERTPNTQRPSSKQTPRGPSAVQRDDLNECRYCHRRFASDRLQIHEDICSRTGKKKRKEYDATRHRLEGTELAPFVSKPSKISSNKQKSASKPNNWRQKHEEFIASIRSAKVAQQHVAKGGKLSDLPPPPPSSNPDYVQCPHCGRRFNEAAAERHIPKCANFDFNKSKPTKTANKSKGR